MSDLIDRQAAINGADLVIARDTSGNNDVVEAMKAWKMWIKGLPAAQTVTDSHDLISRTAAIDSVCMEWCGVKHQDCKHLFDVKKDDHYWCDGCETALRTLPDLPSAQPEKRTDKRTETHACDCISRQSAIDIVRHECGEWKGLSKEIVKQFNGLPPLETERKKGRWSGDFCSCCGVSKYNYISIRKEDGAVPAGTWNFCPKCGADMREVDADEQTD